MIRFACPACAAPFAVTDDKGGTAGTCPGCGSAFLIPAAAAWPPSPPPAEGRDRPAGAVPIAPCPGCKAPLAVAAGDLGTEVECPYCTTAYRATAAGPSPPPRSADDPGADRRDDNRPSRRRPRDDRGDEHDDRPRRPRRSRRSWEPPQLKSVGGLLLGGGVYGLLHALGAGVFTVGWCCLWPGTWFEMIWAILAIVRATAITNGDHTQGPPTALLALQIATIVNGDVINLVLGIVGLSQLNADEVREYYYRQGF